MNHEYEDDDFELEEIRTKNQIRSKKRFKNDFHGERNRKSRSERHEYSEDTIQ